MTKVSREEWEVKMTNLIKSNMWGLRCGKCNGGGWDFEGEDKCEQCGGCGIFDWKPELMIKEIGKLLSQTRNDLLREIMEEMPERATLRGNLNFSPSSFNEALDQVNTILESKLSTVKK